MLRDRSAALRKQRDPPEDSTLDPAFVCRLQSAQRIHLDQYGGRRLPFACVFARGLRQRLVALDGPDVGRVYDVIDASGGYATACLGAGHPLVTAALPDLLARCGYSTDEIADVERSRFLLELFGPGGMWADTFPAEEYHVSGRNSGSEGIELALRLVQESAWDAKRLRPKKEREPRRHVLAFEGAWHGWTAAAQALSNRRHYRIGLPDALADGPHGLIVDFLPFGEPILLEDYFAAHGNTLAAVFVEPVQGDAGILLPPDGYLRRLSQLCHTHDALLVADEVLTFAKTGRFFAMTDQAGPIQTDITIIGKGLGLGAVPIALVIARRDLTVRTTGAVATSDLRPLTCGLLREGMRYIVETHLLEESLILGKWLRQHLAAVVTEFRDLFNEVRGVGFLNGIELTEQAAAHIPEFRRHIIEGGAYVEFMAGAGRRTHGARYVLPAMRIAPPLIASKDDLDGIVGAVRHGAERVRRLLA
jgi:ornithine--oxo-acid transaminase